MKDDDGNRSEVENHESCLTKRTALSWALNKLAWRRRQLKVLRLAGKIEFDPKYEYKAQRNQT